MNIDTRIRKSFAAQSMMQTLGAEIDTVSDGRVSIVAPILKGSRQQHDFGHAGLTFAIGDSAAGYAALTLMPEDREVVTAEMKINLLAPAMGDRLIATGQVERAGKRLVVVTAKVVAETNGETQTIALLQGTMMPVAI